MIIKVCGMRNADNIRELDEAKIADWMGFIFFKKSARNVDSLPEYMPQNSKRVGVFVNDSLDEIVSKTRAFHFNLIQLHGNESIEYIKALRITLPKDVEIIKMIQVESIEDINGTTRYEGLINYFLFETKCQGYGGSGKQFDWEILHSYKGNTPFLITGGISPNDVDKIKTFHHRQFVGIDLNSKFELSPALKDIKLLNDFIKQIKQ